MEFAQQPSRAHCQKQKSQEQQAIMKSSLVILYHREPYDEVVENGTTVYREKKPQRHCADPEKFFCQRR